jgi:hypothetical protein
VSTATAALIACVVAASPFAGILWADPLGVPLSLTLAMLAFIFADAAGLIALPRAAGIALTVAVTSQDYLLLPVMIVYALSKEQTTQRRAVAIAACTLPALILCAIDVAVLHNPPRIQISGLERSSVFAGIAVCVFAPLLAYLYSAGIFDRIQWNRRAPATTIFMAIALAALSPFALDGDPSWYWLAIMVATLFYLRAKVAPVPNAQWAFVIFLGVTLLAQGYTAARGSSVWPTVQVSREAWAIQQIVTKHASENICVYGTTPEIAAVSDALSATLYRPTYKKVTLTSQVRRCLFNDGQARFVALESGRVTDFGKSGVALALAVSSKGKGDLRISAHAFFISPNRHTHMPGGRGAFKDTLKTPTGDTEYFTIAAPFALTFPCINWNAGDRLTFATRNPLGTDPRAGAVRLTVLAGREPRATAIVIPPSQNAASPDWTYHTIEMRHDGRCAALTFDVKPDGKNGIATWASVVNPVILKSER